VEKDWRCILDDSCTYSYTYVRIHVTRFVSSVHANTTYINYIYIHIHIYVYINKNILNERVRERERERECGALDHNSLYTIPLSNSASWMQLIRAWNSTASEFHLHSPRGNETSRLTNASRIPFPCVFLERENWEHLENERHKIRTKWTCQNKFRLRWLLIELSFQFFF
jgi:hypothetical protein